MLNYRPLQYKSKGIDFKMKESLLSMFKNGLMSFSYPTPLENLPFKRSIFIKSCPFSGTTPNKGKSPSAHYSQEKKNYITNANFYSDHLMSSLCGECGL